METSCWPSPLSKACAWLQSTRSPVVAGYVGQIFVLPRIKKLKGSVQNLGKDLTMSSRIARYSAVVGIFLARLGAQQSALDALQKARVLERLAEAAPLNHQGTSPSFVLDPAWPKPLPHHWMIGDIGGIFVDRRDHIW